MRRALRAVLFDWDGTLVDSAETSYHCYEAVFASLGIPFDRGAFRRTYSPNWHFTYAALGLPEARWPEADVLWLEHYRRARSVLLPGARETLLRLRETRFVQGIVTSGDRERVTRELATLAVADFFATVVCGADVSNRKPHPEPLLFALERLGVGAGEAAYVGDSPEDVQMARAAGVFSVGIPGGFPNREALLASAPDLLAHSLEEAAGALGA